MPIEITTAFIGIVAALLGGWVGAAISRKSATDILKKEQFFTAASKFRSTVLYELTSLYPIDQFWDKKEFPRLYQSIPKINSAAAEFRYFVNCKADFDKSISEYNQYCRENTADKVFCLDFYQNMPGTKNRNDYIEQFKNIVEHILSFANEK